MGKGPAGATGKKLFRKVAEKVIVTDHLKTTIPAGMALPGPPLGPLLGQRGINISAFCKDFNTRTSIYKEGVPLPCRIKVNPDRTYYLSIFSPTSMYFLSQAAGIQRGSMDPGEHYAGKITIKHIYEIAKIKNEDPTLQFFPLQQVCEKLIGTCRSMGIEVVRDIDPKEYGAYLAENRTLVEQQLQELQEIKEAKLLRK